MQIYTNSHFSIPKAIVEFVISSKLERAFSVYLCLKMLFGGVVHESKLCFNKFHEILGIRDKRTVLKYIQILLSNGFIGFNKKTKNFFIRGFHFLYKKIKAKGKQCLIVPYSNIKDIKSIFAAGLIGFKIEGLKLAQNRFLNKKVGSSALNKRVALQKTKLEYSMRTYYGLSNTQIASLLGYSKSAANRVKSKCHDLKLIKVKKQSKLIRKIQECDFNIRLFAQNSEKLFITKNSKGELLLKERLTDEIQPNIVWVKRKKYV